MPLLLQSAKAAVMPIDKRVMRRWRKMLGRGLITPSEYMLFRKIMELELEISQLKETIEILRRPAKSGCQVGHQVDEVTARDVSDQNPIPIDLQSRRRYMPSHHDEPTLEELCRPLSAKATSRSFRL